MAERSSKASEPPATRECPSCGDVMRLAHAGQATAFYVCPCCGASVRHPPLSAMLPEPMVAREKQ